MRVVHGLFVAVVVSVFARTASAADYCTSGSDFLTMDPIPVVLNEDMATALCSGDSTCASQGDIERTVQASLLEWYTATGAQVRFSFEGSQPTTPGATIAGKIHVYAAPCNGDAFGDETHDPAGGWARIRICSFNGDNGDVPVYWDTYLEDFDPSTTPRSFQWVMLHELGHALNLDHQESCTGPVGTSSSIMSQPYYDNGAAHLGYPDSDFASDHYGDRIDVVSRRDSTDGLNWTELSNSAPVGFTGVRGRLAVSNSDGTGSNMLMAYTTDDGSSSVVRVRRPAFKLWVTVRDLITVTTNAPAIAKASDTTIYLVFEYIQSLGNHYQRVYASKTTDGGSTWTGYIELTTSTTRTRNMGVSTTWDPATGKFITLWRGSGGTNAAITFRVEGGGGPYVLVDNNGDTIKSADNPSIACGAPAIVGVENCLVAWTNVESWSRTTLWTQGHIVGDQLVVPSGNLTRTHAYVTAAGATVSYIGDTGYPWQIVLTQGGQTEYTWRKGPAWANTWQDQRSFSESPLPTPAAAGAEAGLRWIYVTDH